MVRAVKSETLTNRVAWRSVAGRRRSIQATRSGGCSAGSARQDRSCTTTTVAPSNGRAIRLNSW